MPPKSAKLQPKVVYPQGVKEITDDLGTDELVRRLKSCAQAFQNMGQDDDNSEFVPLATYLAQDNFLEHSNKDVRLLVACCIADVFRVFAPDAPYKDPEHLKNVFLFFIKQLRGLEDPKDAAFKRYFYLLENLAWVKSFNICIELEENQEIFCQLFTLMFNIVNDDHSVKVKGFMLDMMAPLISEADSVSQELLDIILANIIEPRKSQNRNAYSLARDLLKKTSSTIEPYIQAFFNNALILGKTSESDVATHLYELIYELNSISPSVLLAVLPQLEFKLKSNDEKERLDVTRLLARMFSDKNSELAVQHKNLWTCFLGRFKDISVGVRQRCVQYSMHFLLNHPELRTDITEQLKERQHDPEESVRYEVVMAIISAAKRDFSSISDELLDFVKERTLDKKFKIRKEALVGLSMIFKRCMTNPEIPQSTRECVSWIKNKVLHVYYQTALEDRLLVERILHTCLVPYQLSPEDRMKKLYQLYATVDEHAVKAFNELLKCQHIVRNHVRGLLELHAEEKNEETEKQISQKITVLGKSLPEPVKAQEFLRKFNSLLLSDARVRNFLENMMKTDCLCRDAEENVRELLKKLGNPIMTNVFYMTVKQLLERVAPVMVDKIAIEALIGYVEQALLRTGGIIEEVGDQNAPERGLQLLHVLSYVFPGSFVYPAVYNKLLGFLQLRDETCAEITLQIFSNISESIESSHPDICEKLIQAVVSFAKEGTTKQAKYAIQCLNVVTENKSLHFGAIVEDLKKNLTLECQYFRTALVSLGHIALLFPETFGTQMKAIVSKTIVKDLLMQDKEIPHDTDEEWCTEEELSDETRAKIEGMKLIVRWLLGLKNDPNSGNHTLRLLTSVVEQNGDLMKKGNISKPEMAWLRVTAGCCMLKVVQEQAYLDILSNEQFQAVARLLLDKCYEVRERFAQKLHKGLIALKLPLDFMAIFAFGAKESHKELRDQLKQFLLANINKRRDFLKQQTQPPSNSKLAMVLPDYVLPYAIHLLAHDPDYKKYDNVPTLEELRKCLWFLMEPLVIKSDSYSFTFVKKLLENMKQTKDAQSGDNEVQNMKLYAICDLALGLLMSKTANFVLKEFPEEMTTLPSKLFTEIDRTFINSKIYLPQELASMFPKGLTLEFDHHKPKPSAKETGMVTRRGRGRPPAHNGASSLRSKRSEPSDNFDTLQSEGRLESGEPMASKRQKEDATVEFSEIIGDGQMFEGNHVVVMVQGDADILQDMLNEKEQEDTRQEETPTTQDSNEEQLLTEDGIDHTTTEPSSSEVPSSQLTEEQEDNTEETSNKDESLSISKKDGESSDGSGEEDLQETVTKRPTAASKPDVVVNTKRLRSAGPAPKDSSDDDKTRSTRLQSTESNQETTEGGSSDAATASSTLRTSQRQSSRKQVITTREGLNLAKDGKLSIAKEPVRKVNQPSAPSQASSKTTSSSSSPNSSPPAKRNLRQNVVSNGRKRTVDSDEDSSSSTARKSARLTRAAKATAIKEMSSSSSKTRRGR